MTRSNYFKFNIQLTHIQAFTKEKEGELRSDEVKVTYLVFCHTTELIPLWIMSNGFFPKLVFSEKYSYKGEMSFRPEPDPQAISV